MAAAHSEAVMLTVERQARHARIRPLPAPSMRAESTLARRDAQGQGFARLERCGVVVGFV